MRSARTETFWQAYRRHAGLDKAKHQVTLFRTPPEVAERLFAMTTAGAVRAVASPMHYFGEGREEPLPAAGEYALLVDSRERPRLIWRTTAVSIGPLASVSERHLWADGQGGGDRETWMAMHRRGFTRQARLKNFEMHDDIETMFKSFEVVWPDNVAQRLELLVPYLERGFALRQRLDEQRTVTEGLEAILARIDTAVLTIDRVMRLHFVNPAAERLLRREDGLRLKDRKLTARWLNDIRTLTLAVAATARTDGAVRRPTNDSGMGKVVEIGRGEGCLPYRAIVLPLVRDHAVCGLVPGAEAVVFIDDPEVAATRAPVEDLFRYAFHLTPAEARLAAYLAAGDSLTDAADAFGVTRNTVRAQLRSIFDKTDARRQADLVRLLQTIHTLRISFA